jgi:hypothetical protein
MPSDDLQSQRCAFDDLVSLAVASRMTGRDRKTLMKDIEAGRFPHATREPSGRQGHLLLVQDLVDAGLLGFGQVAPPSATTRDGIPA